MATNPRLPAAQPKSAMSDRALPDPYLTIRNLGKRFGDFSALRDIDLDVYPGEFVSFLGPSGCGKTTLLRAISGLDVQTNGSIHQAGQDISELPVNRRDFGIVFQSYALFPNLRIKDNVAYGLISSRRGRAQIEVRVQELLTMVGLSDQADKYPAQLSGGQQQRVSLARALALSPGLLLLDEPLSALDARVRSRLRCEIRELQQRLGITTIMVTHDQEEALTMSDRIVVMNKGRIEQVGTPDEVYRKPASTFVADFIGRMNFIVGKLTSPSTANCAGTVLSFLGAPPGGDACNVTVCLRPEDVVVRDAGSSTNVFDAEVDAMEFMGDHFATTLRVASSALSVLATLSINDVRDLDIRPGVRVSAALPADRLHVFAGG